MNLKLAFFVATAAAESYEQCVERACGTEMAPVIWPEGWGDEALADIRFLNSNSGSLARKATACVCQWCGDHDEVKNWPANEGSSNGPGCQAAGAYDPLGGAYQQCFDYYCSREAEGVRFPEGWGNNGAADINTINGDAGIKKAVACTCTFCSSFVDLQGWPANQGQANGPGCQAAGTFTPTTYHGCTQFHCKSELAHVTFPIGWGEVAADDIATIKGDLDIQAVVRCVCDHCDSFGELIMWPANGGKADGPGCQAGTTTKPPNPSDNDDDDDDDDDASGSTLGVSHFSVGWLLLGWLLGFMGQL